MDGNHPIRPEPFPASIVWLTVRTLATRSNLIYKGRLDRPLLLFVWACIRPTADRSGGVTDSKYVVLLQRSRTFLARWSLALTAATDHSLLSAGLRAQPVPVEEGQVQQTSGGDGDIPSRADVNGILC